MGWLRPSWVVACWALQLVMRSSRWLKSNARCILGPLGLVPAPTIVCKCIISFDGCTMRMLQAVFGRSLTGVSFCSPLIASLTHPIAHSWLPQAFRVLNSSLVGRRGR